MKIKLHFFSILLTLIIFYEGGFLMAQQKQGTQNRTTYYSTDFEDFTLGGQVACQNPTNWTTWSNAPCGSEDGSISNDFAQSGTKSAKVENTTDLLLLLGDRTTGNYELSWNMYVENTTGGYYNLQHFEAPGTEFALEIYFFQNGTGELTAGGINTSFTYPKATWFQCKHLINLDNDLIQLYVDDELVSEWPFSYQSGSTTGTNQLGGVDFYAGFTNTETPRYYFDDVVLKDAEVIPVYMNDMSVQSIIEPTTGYSLTNNEIVIVKVKNNYTEPLSNIPISYQINSGSVVNEVIPGPVAAGAQLNYSFNQRADLSIVGDYEVIATVSYPGDENSANNTLTKVVSNLGSIITMQDGTFSSCDGGFYDSGGDTATYQPSENFTITILPSMPGGKINFNFTLFDTENNYDFLRVYDGIDVSAPLIGSFSGPGLPSALQNLIASDDNSSGGITFNFTSDGSVQGAGWAASISCIAPPDHDLAATSVTGLSNPVINTPADYTVTISNTGLNPELGSDYLVKLFDAYDEQIGVANGVDIGVQGTQDFTFTWTPEIGGAAYLYGTVEFTGDMNPSNDRSPNFAVIVMPIGQIDITIGTGTETSWQIPVATWAYGYSFSQVLYLQSELNIANKQIFRIGYQYVGVNPNLDFNVEVYLSHTTATELTASVPLTNFTKVYDGPWFCHAGDDFSYIDIIPFNYNNTENLIITIIEKKPGYTSPADAFKVTPTEADQHLAIVGMTDQTPYDPNNLPAGNQMSIRPNTKLFLGDVPTNPASNTFPSTLSFGEVEMTQTDTMQVNVTNIGGGTMEITGVTSSNSNFTVADATFPISLTTGQHHTFDVVFAPTAPALEQGVITFLMDENIPGGKTVQVSGRGLRYGVLRESFEGELFPPLGWSVVDVNGDNKGWVRNVGFAPTGQTAPRTGIACASLDVYAGTPGQTSYDDWLITPKMIWQSGDVFSFYIKRLANQSGQIWRVCLSTSSADVSDFQPIDQITDPDMTYTEKSYDLSQFGLTEGDEFYIGLQFNGLWCWPGVIDDVLGSVLVRHDYDLMMMNLTADDDIIYENTPVNFHASIGNFGFNDVAAADYTVQVCAYVNGVETVFGTTNGQNLAMNDVLTLTVPVSIPTIGMYDLYAKIAYAPDMDLTNNYSEIISVEVISSSIVVKDIGDFPIPSNASSSGYYPISFEDYRGTSLSQTMYFVNELNTGGIIERLSYYRNLSENMAQRNIKVWMIETPNTSLDNYIAPSQQTLVFDGQVDFAAGIGRSNIQLNQSFVYSGSGNLVVTVYYYGGSNYSDFARFMIMEGYGPNRTMVENGWQAINPESPVYIGTTVNYPYTSLMFETGNGLGSINGTVLYQSNNAPVEGAKVEIENPDYPDQKAVLYTNTDGYYNAPYAMAGSNLTVTISKYGYTDVVYNNVNLPNGGNVNLGTAYLVPRPVIAVNGHVIKSDTQTPAQNAVVNLFGLDNYQTTTDANGDFSFPAIWGSTTYEIDISLDGYQTYISDITVPGINYTIPTITILELAPQANLVNAVEIDNYALVTWYAAGQPYPMQFRYDDGEAVGVLITTGDPNIIGGSAWNYDAVVQGVQWYTYQLEGWPSSTEVKITILGLNPDASPNPSDVLFIQENITNNYEWNTFTLPESIAAPNGFFVGISGYNNVTLIAYDDGIGEPYVFQTRTQWSNGMGSYNPLEEVTSPPLFGNIFVRATGLTSGPLNLDGGNASASFLVEIPEGLEPLICKTVERTVTGSPLVPMIVVPARNERSFESYNVYRKNIEADEWTQMNATAVSDTFYIDNTWADLTFGLYKYAVEAEYTNGVTSELAESNIIEKNMRIDLNLIVNTNTGVPNLSAGADVTMTNQNGNVNYVYEATVGENGAVLIPDIMKGTYTLDIVHVGFENYQETDIDLYVSETSTEKTVTIIERISDPYDLAIITTGQPLGAALFLWNREPVIDDVESYDPFLIDNIGNWTVVDQDNNPTTYPAGATYPHAGEPASFMTFDRSLTTPPLSEAYWGSYSGSQYFASFSSASGATNNWLISEEQHHTLPFTFSFMAKSITETYGLETFRIGYSTTGTELSDFVFITGSISTLTYWTQFSYAIPADAKYVAIRHNHTGFALLVDDILLGVETDGAIPGNGFTVNLNDELVAIGVDETQYLYTGLIPGTYTASVQSNFYTGNSNIIDLEFVLPAGFGVNFTVNDINNQPLTGANIDILYNDVVITSALTVDGLASFELYPGTYSYQVSYEGYVNAYGTFNVTSSNVDITVTMQLVYNLTFSVLGADNQPLSGATVVFQNESGTTDANGEASFETSNGTFPYAVTHPDYNRVLSTVTVTSDTTVTVLMPDLACESPNELTATQNIDNVTLSWLEPVSGENGTWIHWDGEYGNIGVGTGGPIDFDVAQRFEPTDLTDYNDNYLTRIIFYPREAACTYSVRVWTGGNISAPEMMVVDQEVENPLIGQWNEILLAAPVLIDATKELWIGVRNNTTTDHPAGCDAGPAINGKGNMINLAGTGWQTLLEAAPTFDYNWSVRGLVEPLDAPDAAPALALVDPFRGSFTGTLSAMQFENIRSFNEPRELLGYNIYRNSELINADTVTDLTFTDNSVPLGTYLYNITSLWSNGCESDYSNTVTVEISEISCPPPVDFVASIDANNPNLVNMTWNPVEPTEFRYDDGIRLGQLGSQSGTLNTIIGNKHATDAALTEMSWLLSEAVNGGGPHATVQIYVFGLTEAGLPNSNDVLFSQSVSNTDGIWNTYSFDTPIQATGGFFLGVAYNGFVGLGTDDGTGAPYEFIPNTHYFTDDYTGGSWSTWEGSGFNVNGMIRAIGVPGSTRSYTVNTATENPDTSFELVLNEKAVNTGSPDWKSASQKSRDLLGFNVYKEDTMIQELWTETNYSYTEMEQGVHCYSVTAVYTNCSESDHSNDSCVDILVGIPVTEAFRLKMYPNPAQYNITIEGADLQRIQIQNYTGQQLLDYDLKGKQKLQLNIATFEAGVYMVKITTKSGEFMRKLIVIH